MKIITVTLAPNQAVLTCYLQDQSPKMPNAAIRPAMLVVPGGGYQYMSGTSMATPQIAGAMAVLMQYLRQNYPQYQEAELRQVAANLLMSTADPILDSNGLEVSPRGQGAGLANLVKATSSLAYLSNAQAYENRAKAELGDDDAKNGVYAFPFTINNMSGEKDLTYTFNASILTETVVTYTNGTFIGHAPYALGASLTVAGATESNIMKYDFNDDGEITTADARVLLLHVTDDAPIAEDNVHYAYLDVNGDGTVNKDDVDVITAYCAELEVGTDLTENAVISGTEALESVTVPAGESVTLTAAITLTAEDKATVESEIANFKKVREGNNAEEIKNAMDAFTQKVYAIFGKLYQQQGGEQCANPEQPQAGTQNADGTYEADGDVH